jgi:hypothetical protein
MSTGICLKKHTHTMKKLLIGLALILVVKTTTAQVNTNAVSFTTNATLSTNFGVGQSYIFADVANGTQAKVTILELNGGASLEMIDDNNLTMPAAFAPRITVPGNSVGSVKFKIEFLEKNNLTPKPVLGLSTTLMDIDGTTNQFYEFDAIDMGGNTSGQFHDASPEIALTKVNNNYSLKNFAGIEYVGVDTAALKVKYTVTANNQRNWFEYTVGVDNRSADAITRQKGLYVFYYTSALPVRYTNITAKTYDNGVIVNWATEYERENSHFEVERSFDRASFTTVGLVLDAMSATGSNKNYAFKDNAAVLKSKDVVYYRLKQVDLNGKVTYSSVIAVKLKVQTAVSVSVFPSPVVNNATVSFNTADNGTASVQVIALNGQVVKTTNLSVTKGVNNVALNNLENLAAGAYLVVVKQNSTVLGTTKITK